MRTINTLSMVDAEDVVRVLEELDQIDITYAKELGSVLRECILWDEEEENEEELD